MSNTARSDASIPAVDAKQPTIGKDSEQGEELRDSEDVEAEDSPPPSTTNESVWELLQTKHTKQSKERGVPTMESQDVLSPLEQQLSDLVRSFSIAINARMFDVSQSPWCDNLDVKFHGVPSKVTTAKKAGALNSVEYVAHLQRLVKKHPAYHIDVESIDCWKDPGQGFAQVFLNYDVTGVPPGVTRKSVAIFKLRRNAGNVWRCYNVQSADGMAGSEGGAGAGF